MTNDSLGFRVDPTTLFPRLPEDAVAAKQGWDARHEREDARSHYTLGPGEEPDAAPFVFVEVRESPMDTIYLSSHKSTFTFDRERGVITRVETESTQGYGFNGKGTGTTELQSVETHDADWVARFARESDRYFAANHEYEDLLRRASQDADTSDSLLADARKVLESTREEMTLPVLRDQLVEQIESHGQMASYYAEEADRRAKTIGKPAADWSTKDLAGRPHALADYHGKVLVLDFWYRGCGWCIRAMPQIKQLAARLRGPEGRRAGHEHRSGREGRAVRRRHDGR